MIYHCTEIFLMFFLKLRVGSESRIDFLNNWKLKLSSLFIATGNEKSCIATILKGQSENDTVISRSCLSKAAIKSDTCGVTINSKPGKIEKSCCCDSSTNCNDDEFLEKCIMGTLPKPEMTSFGCHRHLSTDSISVSYSPQVCAGMYYEIILFLLIQN